MQTGKRRIRVDMVTLFTFDDAIFAQYETGNTIGDFRMTATKALHQC